MCKGKKSRSLGELRWKWLDFILWKEADIYINEELYIITCWKVAVCHSHIHRGFRHSVKSAEQFMALFSHNVQQFLHSQTNLDRHECLARTILNGSLKLMCVIHLYSTLIQLCTVCDFYFGVDNILGSVYKLLLKVTYHKQETTYN